MGYWYCPNCDCEVPSDCVSYEETHEMEGCGHPVEWIEDEEDEE